MIQWTTFNLKYLTESQNRAVLFDLVEFISVFSTAVGRVDFQRWLTDSVYIRRELKAKGKKNAFNKPS